MFSPVIFFRNSTWATTVVFLFMKPTMEDVI
jgi:hypothetical protein